MNLTVALNLLNVIKEIVKYWWHRLTTFLKNLLNRLFTYLRSYVNTLTR